MQLFDQILLAIIGTGIIGFFFYELITELIKEHKQEKEKKNNETAL